jgi:hypothetical protein
MCGVNHALILKINTKEPILTEQINQNNKDVFLVWGKLTKTTQHKTSAKYSKTFRIYSNAFVHAATNKRI